MTTVQVPRALVRMLPRFQVHRRQPFYEILAAAMALLTAPSPGGERPP